MAEQKGEKAIAEPSDIQASSKPKKQFLKKGTRKFLSSGRVKSKPKPYSGKTPKRRPKIVQEEHKEEEQPRVEEDEQQQQEEFKFDYKDYINEITEG